MSKKGQRPLCAESTRSQVVPPTSAFSKTVAIESSPTSGATVPTVYFKSFMVFREDHQPSLLSELPQKKVLGKTAETVGTDANPYFTRLSGVSIRKIRRRISKIPQVVRLE
jgi:hypothetical protein